MEITVPMDRYGKEIHDAEDHLSNDRVDSTLAKASTDFQCKPDSGQRV